ALPCRWPYRDRLQHRRTRDPSADHYPQECALRWLRWRWPCLGNDRHAAHHSEDERRRPPCLAYADPRAHRRRLAKHPDRRPHALELQPVAASPTRLPQDPRGPFIGHLAPLSWSCSFLLVSDVLAVIRSVPKRPDRSAGRIAFTDRARRQWSSCCNTEKVKVSQRRLPSPCCRTTCGLYRLR